MTKLQKLGKLKYNFYNATIFPWKNFDGYKKLRFAYSEPIHVVYSKEVLLGDEFIPSDTYRYFIVEPNYRNFEAAFMLTIKAESFMLEKNSLHGTIYSPTPIFTIDGYVHIMNDDDLTITGTIKDGDYRRRSRVLLKGVDKASKKIVEEYTENILGPIYNDEEFGYGFCKDKIISFFYSHSFIFAQMLKAYFKRGTIMCVGPNMHYVWVDVNGRCYDARGAIEGNGHVMYPQFKFNCPIRDKNQYSKDEYDKLIHTLDFKWWPNC